MVDSLMNGDIIMTDEEMEDFKEEIQESFTLTANEIESLLSELPANTKTVGTGTDTFPKVDFQSSFEAWYRKNYFYISLLQWLVLFFIVIKISNK